MKKALSLLLTLCLLLSALPTQVFAYVGDIWPASNTVEQRVLNSGSLALQNEYLRVIARWDGTLSTTPAADGTDPTDRQTPFCEFVTYGSNHITHPASLRLKSLKFVKQTPNGTANAIQAEYNLTVDLASSRSAERPLFTMRSCSSRRIPLPRMTPGACWSLWTMSRSTSRT